MKRLLFALVLCHFAGCDAKIEPPPEPATPPPAPKAAATPKPGEWLMKDYKNPLDPAKKAPAKR